MLNKVKSYVIGIAIPVVVGLLSAFLTRGNMDIYQTIVKPDAAPPAILFPIVWTILYVLMGIGSVLVYNSDGSDGKEENKKQALLFYGLQLFVNFFWSVLFFNERAFLTSFLWLLLLWFLVIGMILSFRKVSKPAAWLQIPYLLWVTFAGYLNLMIYLLNR